MGTLRILADSNCIIDYTDSILPVNAIRILTSARVEMSVINRMELLSKPSMSPAREQLLLQIVGTSLVHPLDEAVVLKTIAIRRQKRIKLPDAIIAATALVHGLPLYTNNTRDFRGIPELRVVDPRAL